MINKFQTNAGPLLIAVSGKLGSGKDTLANMLVNKIVGLEKRAFANKLKKIVAMLAGVDESILHTQDGKNTYIDIYGMTLGEMLQQIGTDYMRRFDENVWIKSLMVDYMPDSKWIITDTRFKNEAKAIREKGGILIRIEGDPALIRANSKRNLTHQSEVDLDEWTDWDYKVTNTGSFDALEIRVNEIYNDIKNNYKI